MSKQEHIRNLWISVGVLLFSIVYFFLARTQVVGQTDGFRHVSGRTFPYILSGTLFILSIVSIILNYFQLRSTVSNEKIAIEFDRIKRAALYIFSIALYTVGIMYVGYTVSTFAFIIFAMWFSGTRISVGFFIVAIVLPPALYIIFHMLMKIPLPSTPLF